MPQTLAPVGTSNLKTSPAARATKLYAPGVRAAPAADGVHVVGRGDQHRGDGPRVRDELHRARGRSAGWRQQPGSRGVLHTHELCRVGKLLRLYIAYIYMNVSHTSIWGFILYGICSWDNLSPQKGIVTHPAAKNWYSD